VTGVQTCALPISNHLYCLDGYLNLLFVIDGDSNRVLRAIPIPASNSDPLLWSPASNKVYVVNSSHGTVSILDCASDSIVATVRTGESPRELCCSDDGRVYVANYYGGSVAIIDGSADTVLRVVPVGRYPSSLCYDRTDNKAYVGEKLDVRVIDVAGDSVVASISLSVTTPKLGWNQNYDKLYVCGNSDSMAVIDCKADTVLGNIQSRLSGLYSDSVCKKVYGIDNSNDYLRIFDAASDSLRHNLRVGYVTALLDNGKQGPANRLYCTERDSGTVAVVAGYKTDSVLRHIGTGVRPVALAWNPTHSWIYVSNSGSSSITVIRDTFGIGVEESQPQAPSHKLQATMVRGVLLLPEATSRKPQAASLLDISGRKVLDLKPGANDVRALAPGVYFVREEQAQAQTRAIRKVVVTR
jgi:YVTN family beta-propeller protein